MEWLSSMRSLHLAAVGAEPDGTLRQLGRRA
jgi:hypothetical protein